MLRALVFNPACYIGFGDFPGRFGCEGEEEVPGFVICAASVGRRVGCEPEIECAPPFLSRGVGTRGSGGEIKKK